MRNQDFRAINFLNPNISVVRRPILDRISALEKATKVLNIKLSVRKELLLKDLVVPLAPNLKGQSLFLDIK